MTNVATINNYGNVKVIQWTACRREKSYCTLENGPDASKIATEIDMWHAICSKRSLILRLAIDVDIHGYIYASLFA